MFARQLHPMVFGKVSQEFIERADQLGLATQFERSVLLDRLLPLLLDVAGDDTR